MIMDFGIEPQNVIQNLEPEKSKLLAFGREEYCMYK